jgi:sulfur-oxidizing protein SoxY
MTTRRHFLLLAGSALAGGAARAQLAPNVEALRKAAFAEAVRKASGGAPVRRGRVKLDVPALIDNGNSVALVVEVESAMTATDYVKTIHVFTEKNPQPYIIAAHLGPRAGRARVTTRARIAESGTILALAEMSDGSFWSDSVSVVVTLSACGDEGPS